MNKQKRFNLIWRALLLGLVLAGMAVTLSACGDEEVSHTPANRTVVDVVLKTQSSEFWGYVEVGCRAYAKEHPDTVVEIKGASSESAVKEQSTIIQSDLESGRYHAMVLAPLNSESASNLIDESDIPVIALDTILESSNVRGFAGMNNQKAAMDGAKAAVEAAKKKGWEEIRCVEIAGTEGESTSKSRRRGFQKGVREAGGTFLDEPIIYAHSNRDEAKAAMEEIMKKYPEGLAIVAAHNDDCAMAALEAAAGNEAYRNTIFIGFDGNGMACQALQDDPKYANFMTVGQNPYEMGYRAVAAAVQATKGKRIKGISDTWTGNAPLIDTGWMLINDSTVAQRLRKIQSNWDLEFKPSKLYKGEGAR